MRSTGSGDHHARPLGPRAYLVMTTFPGWLVEIPIAAVNAFVLMDRVWAPHVGELHPQ